MKHFILPILIFCSILKVDAVSLNYKTEMLKLNQRNVKISFNLDQHEAIFSESLHLSSDHPDFTIEKITIERRPQEIYLPDFKESHTMYGNSFVIDLAIQHTGNSIKSLDQSIYLHFKTYPDLKMTEQIIPITTFQKEQLINPTSHFSSDKTATETIKYRATQNLTEKSYAVQIQDMIKDADSLWLKMLLVLLLGLLFSLTPCIYPMIPITIGILHQQGKKSVWYNFFGSFSYASGLSTTFACLGLLAAFAGASFGSALSNPIFVAFIVLFLGYMSLTMIGVIDMYTPKFMRGGAQMNTHLGPILSTFLFGLISGTIASPCVSPGLFFLLTVVADIGSYLSGFGLLFMFGIGMNIPLMAIATFSNSTKFLPRSGMWMVEVKRMLGFMMFLMCFYYLNNVVPFSILIWLITFYFLSIALYYIISAQSSSQHKTFKSFVGIALLGLTIFLANKIYELHFFANSTEIQFQTPWVASYEAALAQARNEGKAVLLDFWAHHCTICKAIDSKVFKNESFCQAIQDAVVLHKVDCTHVTDEIKTIMNRYRVRTQPVILLINPSNEAILKQWTSEPHSMLIEDFVKEIQEAVK